MIFSELMSDDEEDEPEESDIYEDVYDHALILAAWNSGNADALLHINRSILEKSSEVIEMLITNDMDDYQKQLAIHDWIIDWASFDTEIYNNSPTARPHPHNDNPYGVLIGQRGMCSGFTLTFQLFMDMLDIESIVVEGTNNFGDFHSWNLVRINGEWYAVDVTWNNPVGVEHTPEVTHRFFNVSSEFLWGEGHRWDRDLVPEAG
jgi:transglutaminase/protease-like cytokinesis protein 3